MEDKNKEKSIKEILKGYKIKELIYEKESEESKEISKLIREFNNSMSTNDNKASKDIQNKIMETMEDETFYIPFKTDGSPDDLFNEDVEIIIPEMSFNANSSDEKRMLPIYNKIREINEYDNVIKTNYEGVIFVASAMSSDGFILSPNNDKLFVFF